MPLFHIQDGDRPAYVVERGWLEALSRWKTCVALENECEIHEVEEPYGIAHVCGDDELIVPLFEELAATDQTQGAKP